MPNIAKLLKDEFARLARREIKAAVTSLRKDNVSLKRTAADLKRRVAALESANKRLTKAEPATTTPEAGADGAKARITAKMISSIRTRLGLSQGDFARLVGVSGQSVLKWEHATGRLNFRGDTKQRIVAVRQMGKREVLKQLKGTSNGA